MLGEAELLPTIAEVSIALAGFAGLISVLGARSSREQVRANLWRLRGMLETAALTLAFSLAPFLPAKFGASDDWSWKVAAIAFATAVVGRLVFMVRVRVRPALVNPLGARIIAGTQFLASMMLLSASFWLSASMVVGAYHLLLFVYLLTSAYLFIRVALSVFASAEAGS
jgi:hypothetical protein